MKNVMFLFVFLPSLAFGQVDSLNQALSYYPLGKGDYWEYKTDSYGTSIGGPPFESDSSAYSLAVTGDTLLPNGLRYESMVYTYLYPYPSETRLYERVDSATGCVFRYDSTAANGERPADSLFAATGDTFLTVPHSPGLPSYTNQAVYSEVSNESVVGETTAVKQFREFSRYTTDAENEYLYTLAQGVGISSLKDSWFGGYSNTDLVYARVGGKEYGKKVDVHEDSRLAELGYYPLGKGYYWEYESVASNTEPPFEKDTSLYSLEVVGDTVLTNGYRYQQVRCKDLYPGHDSSSMYERVDSSTGCVFRYDTSWTKDERETDSLFAQPGDSFTASPNTPSTFPSYLGAGDIICLSMMNDTIFFQPTQIKNFGGGGMLETAYGLAKGLGLYSYSFEWDFGHTDVTLIYAKINDVEYGTRILTGVSTKPEIPERFALYQNYPNPFNPTTAISYQLSAASHVTLTVYDVLGRRVKTLVDRVESPGSHEVNFNGSGLASGVYFYRLDAGSYSKTMKLMLLK